MQKKFKFLWHGLLQSKMLAFSLIEMLMALLVASLLMAALAPVMTHRIANSEIKVISESANYEKDTVISVFTENTNFTVPPVLLKC